MPNHIRRITRWLAAPLALFIVRRPYLRTEEIVSIPLKSGHRFNITKAKGQ